MNKTVQPQWLEWAKELQFIAQGGLTYSKDVFDIERFERIREIATGRFGNRTYSYFNPQFSNFSGGWTPDTQ